jgi:hypothetical protein
MERDMVVQPVIPALRRVKVEELEFGASLSYRENSWLGGLGLSFHCSLEHTYLCL